MVVKKEKKNQWYNFKVFIKDKKYKKVNISTLLQNSMKSSKIGLLRLEKKDFKFTSHLKS